MLSTGAKYLESWKSLLFILLAYYLVLACVMQHVECNLKQSADKEESIEDAADSAAQVSTDDSTTSDSFVQEPEVIKRQMKDLIKIKIDLDKDGYVSYEELKNYLTNLHEKNTDFNVNKQWAMYSPQIHEVFSWEGYEPEQQEVLTWAHYFNQTYPSLAGVDIGIPLHREQDTLRIMSPEEQLAARQAEEKDKMKSKKLESAREAKGEEVEDPELKSLKTMVYRADARWKLADENGDTLLTKQEFKYLLHPDEGNEELQALFVKEATEDMDMNGDGKIDLEEFMKHLQLLASDQERDDPSWLASQQENFGRYLDKNKDGVLGEAELKEWLVPTKSKRFAAEAKRLFEQGDTNSDHKLSTVEVLDQFEYYTSLLPAEFWHGAQHEHESQIRSPHDEL